MLVNAAGTSFFYPPIKHSFVRNYFTKTNLQFAANHPKINALISRKNEQTHSLFTSCCHPPASQLKAAAAAVDGHTGIGILEFFQGKNIFVTGATGLLGKVVVEKLLRSTSMGKIYLLIKAKDKEAAFDRLQSEIISSDLFASLKEKYGTSYIGLVREKLIPIVGDICKPNMGMDSESIDAVRKDVHVIIHSAASTTFNERYDLLVDSNVIAPQRVMRFAKTCDKLLLFTHISTAYVNERREGIILEEPMIMGGDDGAVDVADEISLLLRSPPNNNDATTNFFRKIGLQRAEMLGWSTTYQLCKAMGEMCVNEIRGDVPLLIIRPAIIESCYSQPLPGWIQGMRVLDPVIVSYGKGMIPAYLANPHVPLDIIPVDLVANMTIAAIAKHGNTHVTMAQSTIYHVASSLQNPITWFDAFEYLYEYFKEAPLIEGAKISRVKFFDDFEEFSKCLRGEIMRHYGANGDRKMLRQCNVKAAYAEQLCKLYEFVGFLKPRYHTGNIQKLIEEMSKEEQLNFQVDVRNINWKKYFQEIHIPGLSKYVTN
ncbi:fatty acyl-CoA reductase 2, chloroplastic-like [Salvia miltiorrhiza]|uniref:fatty acyl-CoA reductase 2, chloroplastic-like n=1 Tax=Salvia miltiorrhiza TaxID=226208 RepID=UPI0025AC45E1|nr:fatty acyl-CoA reductase 2, chloroplastic-like [Salvia miltiorrhiza]